MELHKVYIWDSKYGIPTNDEEARTIAEKLANTFETEPNPRMVAFGKKMEEFVRPAWAYFGNVPELTAMYHVARDTANCLERIYCLGDLPDSYIANSTGIVARAAAENGLVVAREFEYTVQLLLPDGTEYYEGKKAIGGTMQKKLKSVGRKHWQKPEREQANCLREKVPETRSFL